MADQEIPIELPEELKRLSTAIEWKGRNDIILSDSTKSFISNRLATESWMKKTPHLHQLRKAIILETDYPVSLLRESREISDDTLRTLAILSEDHATRKHLVENLGFSRAIEHVALTTTTDATIPQWWPWVLNNYMIYMETQDISPDLIAKLASEASVGSNFLMAPNGWSRHYAKKCLTRIALRGSSAKHLFEPIVLESLVQGFLRLDEDEIQLLPTSEEVRLHASLIHLAGEEQLASSTAFENCYLVANFEPDSDPTYRDWFLERLTYKRTRRCRINYEWADLSRESLLMYLGLCSSSKHYVCLVGAINLLLVLQSVDPFNQDPDDAASSEHYMTEALQARRRLSFSATGGYDANHDEGSGDQHTLLAECCLLLSIHKEEVIRKFGLLCLGCIPQKILQRIPWSPCLHRFFFHDQEVVTIVMLFRRFNISRELCISHIIPFACEIKQPLGEDLSAASRLFR